MDNKDQILTTIGDEYERWQALLSGLTEAQITARELPGGLSIKDVMAHLMAWQQRSIERLQAALDGREPNFAGWPPDLSPESEEDLDQVNAWIFEKHRDDSWNEVYRRWRDGYMRFMKLSKDTPEDDYFDSEKYPWLAGYTLGHVIVSSYRHHHEEHLEPLQAHLGGEGS